MLSTMMSTISERDSFAPPAQKPDRVLPPAIEGLLRRH